MLGRHLIGDVLKHQLPRELCDRFLDEYNLDSAAILRRVYKEPMPNRFLASVTPFLLKNIEEPAIHRLVLNEFKSFFVRNVAQYDNYRNLPVGFVGSIAFHYRNVLEGGRRRPRHHYLHRAPHSDGGPCALSFEA